MTFTATGPHSSITSASVQGDFCNGLLKRSLGSSAEVEVGLSLLNIGQITENTGLSSSSETFYRDALQIFEHSLGSNHPNVVLSLQKLARCVRARNLDESDRLLNEARAITTSTLGENQPLAAFIYDSLAVNALMRNNADSAEEYAQRGLSIREAVLPEGHPDIAASLNLLASVAYQRGNLAIAESRYRKALRHSTETHDKLSAQLTIQHNLALSLKDQGRLDEAHVLLSDGVVRVVTSSCSNPEVLGRLYYQLGLVEMRRGCAEDAAMLLLNAARAVELRERGTVAVADAYYHLADALGATGRWKESLVACSVAADLYTKNLGEAHAATWDALDALGQTLVQCGQNGNAVLFLEQTLDAMRAVSHEHNDVEYANRLSRALIRLAQLLPEAGRDAEAEALARECLAIRERLLPDGHPQAWLRSNTESALGAALVSQAKRRLVIGGINPLSAEQLREAEQRLLRGYHGIENQAWTISPTVRAMRLREAAQRLVTLYEVRKLVGPEESVDLQVSLWKRVVDRHSQAEAPPAP